MCNPLDTIHNPKVGDRVRLAIFHLRRWVPLCWVRAGDDSSIYMGLAFDKPSAGGMVIKQNEGKLLRFEYDEVEFTEDGYKSSRVSFKADSGEIHYGEDIMKGAPIFPLERPRHLCLFTLAHPDLVPSSQKKNDNDYDIGIDQYPLSENHPLFGAVFALPWNGSSAPKPVEPTSNMTTSFYVLLIFKQLDPSRNIAIQIVLGHGIKGPWPKFPGILVFGHERKT